MKHDILQFLRRKSVKRGVRSVVCLLLALMMTASDALRLIPPMEVTAADTAAAEVSFTNHTLYRWTRVTSGWDLDKRNANRNALWSPVLISYQWTDEKNNKKEYYLDLRTVTQNKDGKYVDSRTPKETPRDGVLIDNWRFLATRWDSIASDKGYPKLTGNYDSNPNQFWTVDDPLTDLGVQKTGNDQIFYASRFATYKIGRNIDWTNRHWAIAAKQTLVCNGYSDVNFTEEGSDRYKYGKEWESYSFQNWGFDGYNDGKTVREDLNKELPSWGLNKGEFRILAKHDSSRDSCLKPSENYVQSEYESSFVYDGKFSVWIGELYNLPTIEAVNKNNESNKRLSGCVGPSDINDVMPKVQADLTVHSGTLLNIGNDVHIASGAVVVVEPGATMTIDATLFNDGTIINYGTIFVRGNGCIRPLAPRYPNGNYNYDAGKIICSGSTDNGKTRTGEGNLIMLKGSAAIFNPAYNLLTVKDGASVELNGTIFCPYYFTLADSDFHIRESGRLICQYSANDAAYNCASPGFFAGTETAPGCSLTKVGYSTGLDAYYTPFIQTGKSLFVNEGTFKNLSKPTSEHPFQSTS